MSAAKTITPAALGARFGAIAGLVFIVYLVVLYRINPKLLFSFEGFMGFALIVFLKIWAVFYLLKIKRFIDFKEGLQTAFMVSVVALLMWVVFYNVLIGVYDTSLIQTRKQVTMERQAERMKQSNFPEAEINETLQKMEKEDYTPRFSTAAIHYAIGLFVGFIYSLVTAALFHYLSNRNRMPANMSPN